MGDDERFEVLMSKGKPMEVWRSYEDDIQNITIVERLDFELNRN